MWAASALLLAAILSAAANPDAKRLYDDLLSNYNRLIRPVSNNTDTVLVKLGLRLSQLIDLVVLPNSEGKVFQSSFTFVPCDQAEEDLIPWRPHQIGSQLIKEATIKSNPVIIDTELHGFRA
ncbi:unnamed protein product [Nezara viridula]|uniref:Neurotransmitter-gated ion-channel ligand-binding domain-containing protein n=1 Tax=Nezara viridula TaxID=85310 RepID=A0A9P0HU25_NEZVI|nr:unnamed protein product [Nezara viridula]